MSNEVVLIDLSSIAYPIWHQSQSDPDANKTSTQTVARVRALATGHPHVAVCCDSGRSFRRELAPSYKANRPEHDASLQHQITLAMETLRADGFPVWAVKGFEADDLIASAVMQTLSAPDMTALVVSADKDLLQLVGSRVRAMSTRDGAIYDDAAVFAKFGVHPHQMRDFLTMVGDTSDNVKGMPSVGPKKAAELLAKFGTLDELYRQFQETNSAGMGLTPSLVKTIREFAPSLKLTRDLITLRSDVEIPFAEIAAERIPKDAETFAFDVEQDMETEQPAADNTAQATTETPPATPTAIAVREQEILPAPADWERGLDPRSMKEARLLANDMFTSRLFSAYGTPQAVLSTVMVGRELGLPALASLRAVHVVEGRHTLSAGLMVALVLKSGLAEYFEPVTFDDKQATFVTKRKGARGEVTLTHTIEMAVTAGLVKEKSNWVKVPTDMLVARAQSRLARMVYPDLLVGLYTPDELQDMRDSEAAA